MPRFSKIEYTEMKPSRQGIIVLSGFGVTIRVDKGHLIISDSIGNNHREGRLSRAQRALERLIVIGHSGYISFDAARWLYDAGIAFVQIDRDCMVIMSSMRYARNDPILRRAQVSAMDTTTGLGAVRYLLDRKLAGQASVVEPYGTETAAIIRQLQSALTSVTSLEELSTIEGAAASFYWPSFAQLVFPFVQRDRQNIPEHWQTIGNRSSTITGNTRKAVTPFHAMLNYVYALLEIETTVALQIIGLDPGIGILHRDQRSRHSFTLDIIEAVRPDVDSWLLQHTKRHSFTAKDFVETIEGECRLSRSITAALSETMPLWRKAVAPIVEHVATALLDGTNSEPLPTLLTERNRSTSRPENRDGAKEKRPRKVYLPRNCKRCGNPVLIHQRVFCSEECRVTYRREHGTKEFQQSGQTALQQRRAAGDIPNATPEAKARASATQRQRHKERRAYAAQQDKPADKEMFRREIAPGLAQLPLSALQNATGLSLRYCSLIRQGKVIPHPRYWEALRGLILFASGNE
jgi:CRISPR-associated endonuclease Cas1